jgi:Tol biopolymer transport system component
VSPRRPILSGLVLLATLAGWAVCAVPAQAAYGPFTLVAGSPQLHLQADYAYDAAISANGEYVAYTGSIASQPGVYREDLATEEVQVVALGAGTGAPSISEDGQYVSFTTDDDPLTGEPAGECSSVYVRDMSKRVEAAASNPSEEAGAYTLVSARNGSTENLTYAKPTTKGQPCGASAAYRVAISGNGSEVAFMVLSESDLVGPQTPPDQVAVRFLNTNQTELVSATRASLEGTGEPQPVPRGAAIAGSSATATFLSVPISTSTAAISADGSTVAWMGIGVQEQTDLATPLPAPPKGGYPDEYAEPLWRRIAAGSRAPTRSVLAGGDASAPECPPSCSGGLDLLYNPGGEETNLEEGPIRGSYLSAKGFATTGTGSDPLDVVTPQLSANGLTVALLSTQPTYGEDPVYRSGEAPPPSANAFVVNMTPGLSRAQAITRLTAWASLNLKDVALAGTIEEIAISPDGTQVAFITAREAFPLAPPALITPPLSQALDSQVYVANLPAGTLEFISQGYEGQPANASSLDASLDEDGGTIALSSSATNLAYGTVDEGTSVFVTHAVDSPGGIGQQSVSPLPGDPDPSPLWSISATASHGAKGSVLLYVSVPGPGTLTASASATVPTSVAESSKDSRSGHGGSSPKRRGGHSASLALARATVAVREVAQVKKNADAAGVLELRLTPASRYRSLLADTGGLYANIRIAFTAADHPVLDQELAATFQAPAKRRRAKSASSRKRTGEQSAAQSGRRR